MIVEWNAHIFSPDTQRYPLHPKAAYRARCFRASPRPVGGLFAAPRR